MSETGSLFLSRPWSPGPHIIYGPNNRKLQTEAPMKITFFAPLPSSVILPIDAQPQTCIQKYILSYSHIAVWESLSILCPRERVCVCVTRVPSSLSSIQVCVCVCVCLRACNQGPLLPLIPFQHTDLSGPDRWPTGVDSLLPIPSCTLAGTRTNVLLPAAGGKMNEIPTAWAVSAWGSLGTREEALSGGC